MRAGPGGPATVSGVVENRRQTCVWVGERAASRHVRFILQELGEPLVAGIGNIRGLPLRDMLFSGSGLQSGRDSLGERGRARRL